MPYCTLILTFNFTSWGLPVLSRSNTIAFAVTTKFNCRSLFVSGISWRSVAKQSSREFATTDPTTRIQDAGFKCPGSAQRVLSTYAATYTLSTSNVIAFLQGRTENFVRRL